MKIYLVHGESGEFSDWTTWIAAGLTSEAQAIALAQELTDKSIKDSDAYDLWWKRFHARMDELIHQSGITKPSPHYTGGRRPLYHWEPEALPFSEQVRQESSPQPPHPAHGRAEYKALPLEIDEVLSKPHGIRYEATAG